MFQGYERPCRAVPLKLRQFTVSFLTVDDWNICPGFFILEMWGRVILSGCFGHTMRYNAI